MSLDVRAVVGASILQERRLELLANNLANVNTVGYKATRPVFSLAPLPNNPVGGQAPIRPVGFGTSANAAGVERLHLGMGPQVTGVKTDFQVGDLTLTGNPLDLALTKPGFFVVQTPKGPRYTRNGSFTLNKENVLVTQEGFQVLGQRGAITLEGKAFEIDRAGKITVEGQGVDSLRVVDFKDADKALRKEFSGMFINVSGNEPQEPEEIDVQSGFLERSNVNPIASMTEMMEVTRAFEAYTKAIQTINDATQRASTEVGRLR
jgi:flagellar basal-body rod protein FlgG